MVYPHTIRAIAVQPPAGFAGERVGSDWRWFVPNDPAAALQVLAALAATGRTLAKAAMLAVAVTSGG